jgi:hypothetical protein
MIDPVPSSPGSFPDANDADEGKDVYEIVKNEHLNLLYLPRASMSSAPADLKLVEGVKHRPDELTRALYWLARSQPFELERHQDGPTQFVKDLVVVLAGQDLPSQESDRLPPHRGCRGPSTAVGDVRHECAQLFGTRVGEDTEPRPIRNGPVVSFQVIGIMTGQIDVALFDEFSAASANRHRTPPDATVSACPEAWTIATAVLRSRRMNRRTTHPAPATIQKLMNR